MSHIPPCPPRVKAFLFALAFALSALTPFPSTVHAQAVTPVRIVPASPCTTDDVRLLFQICTCNAHFVSAVRLDETHARLDVDLDPTVVCVQCAPDTMGLDLGRFPAGPHEMFSDIAYHVVAGPDSGQVHVSQFYNAFTVHDSCPPPPEPIPYLTGVKVGPACPGDSIPVQLAGMFTDPCHAVIELSRVPSPIVGPQPYPDGIRIVYEGVCQACPAVLTPWSGALPIGPLPAGAYRLPVEAWLKDDCRPESLIFLGRTSYPFAVNPCSTVATCYRPRFEQAAGQACDLFVGPDQPGRTVLNIEGPIDVSGVQGRLVFNKPGLRVANIEPVFNGSILKWDPRPDGADFVIVLPNYRPRQAVTPVIAVTVALAGGTMEDYTRLSPEEMLVSDSHGVAIEPCPIPLRDLFDPAATICPAHGCDFNGDGHSDVRDLVLLVNCVLDPGRQCPWNADCDQNGHLDIDDVLCCAHGILGGSHPDSTGAIPAPEVAVRFGAPVSVAGGVDVPVELTARDRIGAAKLAFSYPTGVFASASIGLAQQAPNWLVLDQDGGGKLTLGAIRLAPDAASDAPMVDRPTLYLTLHLVSRAGQSPGGTLSFVSGDFADPNGAVLVTSAAPVAMPLGGSVALAVGAARPNPFARETRFSVSLPHAADLHVGIYDLLGRRVATLWNGPSAAGTRDFVWRRTRDDGTVVPSGIYFYRVSSGGEGQGGKMLVIE